MRSLTKQQVSEKSRISAGFSLFTLIFSSTFSLALYYDFLLKFARAEKVQPNPLDRLKVTGERMAESI